MNHTLTVTLTVLLSFTYHASCGAAPRTQVGDEIIASVDGQPIWLSEIDNKIVDELASAYDFIYEQRMEALTDHIRYLVIKQAAGQRKLSKDDFLQELGSDIAPPSPERVREYMVDSFGEELDGYPEAVANQMEKALLAVSRHDLHEIDRENAISARQNALVDMAEVSINLKAGYLDSPRYDVPQLDSIFLGESSAPVTMTAFFAFDCHICPRYHDTLVQLVDEYNGQLKLVLKHFPLDEEGQGMTAAKAVVCAQQQGDPWTLFDSLSKANMETSYAVEHVIVNSDFDGKSLNSCISETLTEERVFQDIELGESIGVTGTPTIYINGVPLSGLKSISEIRAVIDELLAESGTSVTI